MWAQPTLGYADPLHEDFFQVSAVGNSVLTFTPHGDDSCVPAPIDFLISSASYPYARLGYSYRLSDAVAVAALLILYHLGSMTGILVLWFVRILWRTGRWHRPLYYDQVYSCGFAQYFLLAPRPTMQSIGSNTFS